MEQAERGGNSRPFGLLLVHWHVYFLFRFRGAHIGLIPHNLGGLVVWRVAPRAELLVNAAVLLTKSLLNYLVEGAAGVGYRLLIGGVAGAATLAGRGAAETSPFVKFILISIVVVTATLPSGTVRELSYDREVAIVGVVEIAVGIGIY
jgi:hypothetical protein